MSLRAVLRVALCAAAYGFTTGAVHSLRFALQNLVKLPLLMLVTASVCAICYYLLARWLARQLDARAVARAAFSIFHDLSVLLAALAPVTLFLALTVKLPDAHGLHEYPLFLSANVLAIALSGTLALVRQCKQMLAVHRVPLRNGALLIAAWLGASLLVGAQASWYLRPFCGVAGVDAPFMLGTTPDFRGATSFYEALYHFVQPPDPVRYP